MAYWACLPAAVPVIVADPGNADVLAPLRVAAGCVRGQQDRQVVQEPVVVQADLTAAQQLDRLTQVVGERGRLDGDQLHEPAAG